MSNTIIAAYDGSNHADHAVRVAADLAKSLQHNLVLLNIQPDLNVGNIRRFFSDKEIELYEQESGMKVLESCQQYLKSEGIPFHSVVRDGVPHKEICKYAEEMNARWIVMGSRGMGALVGTILGSVSTGVISHAKCPVIVVPDAFKIQSGSN